MFSIAARNFSRVASRTASNRMAFSSLVNKPQPYLLQDVSFVRHFSAATFLEPAEATDRIIQVVKNFDKVDPAKVTGASKFADDLGLDSLDAVEVVMAIEDEFAIEIPDAEADKIASIADAVEYIASHPMAK